MGLRRQHKIKLAMGYLKEGLEQQPANQWGLHTNLHLVRQQVRVSSQGGATCLRSYSSSSLLTPLGGWHSQVHSNGLYRQQSHPKLGDDRATWRSYATRHMPLAECLIGFLDAYPINGANRSAQRTRGCHR